MVLDSQRSHELEIEMMALLRQRVDGILLITAGDYRWSVEDAAQIKIGTPVVCVDRRPEGLELDAVCVDDSSAAEMGVTHLVEKGYTKIAIITGPLTLRNEQERLRGYRKALRKAGLAIRDSLIWSAGFEQKEIEKVCQQGLRRSTPKPSALFASNGVTGLGVLRAIYAMGLTTPKDIAFATIDEVNVDDLFRPRITSVTQPADEIGRRAVDVLMERIAQRGKEERSYSIVRLPATLTVRESSRAQHLPDQTKKQL
jgi:LacI family transcriptional regulator